jgi:hypothetical protein
VEVVIVAESRLHERNSRIIEVDNDDRRESAKQLDKFGSGYLIVLFLAPLYRQV